MTPDDKKTLKAAASIINRELAGNGDKVTMVGFGTFRRQQRDARTARNPQTGNPIQVPAKSVVRFKASKTLTR